MIAARHSCSSSYTCVLTLECPWQRKKHFLFTQVLSFLGYELDSVKMEVRLPSDKLQKCLSLIQVFLTKPKFTLKTLQSIIGTLNLCSGTSRMSLPKATDWLDNWGVKASLFHPYYKGSAGRPAHVGRIPCQLQPSSWQNNGCRQPAWTCSQTHLEPLAMGQCWARPGSKEHGLSSGSIRI